MNPISVRSACILVLAVRQRIPLFVLAAKHASQSPFGPPLSSLATKDNLSIALGQERVFEIKDRLGNLIPLNAVASLAAPYSRNFGDQVPPLALGFGSGGQFLQV